MPVRSSRQHFVMIGPVTERDAEVVAGRISGSGFTSATISNVACLSGQSPRNRFTAAELDELIRIVAGAWANDPGMRPGAARMTLPQARLAFRAYAAIVGDPEPGEETLASVTTDGR